MSYIKRYLTIDLPKRQSAFIWGARKTGKTTYLKHTFPKALVYDLLKSDLALEFLKAPSIFREELLKHQDTSLNQLVIVDEVQKVPALMDEIHWLIENTEFQFILCGSSARQMKRHGVNMLGGRAWKYHFFPLCFPEFDEFDLLRIFNQGGLPSHYLSPNYRKSFRSYIEDYLILEIQAEGIVRNLPAFSRFFDALRFSNGEMLNYSNIARQAGIDAKTIREYFQILVDTLMGYIILPYRKKVSRNIISETPKFYLFDVGLASFIKHQQFTDLKGSEVGKALEHYILTELMAYKYLNEVDFEINYWRTKSKLEVDFILNNGQVALEVKISDVILSSDLKGLRAFHQEHKPKKSIMVCQILRPRRIIDGDFTLDILPIENFLQALWAGEIVS
jgi:predicted AAA+ superfamily ATPase